MTFSPPPQAYTSLAPWSNGARYVPRIRTSSDGSSLLQPYLHDMGEQHAALATAWFDVIGAGHDHPALGYFSSCACRLVDLLDLQPGQRLLDVGTGTGAVAIEAAARLAGSGSVVGIDLAAAMLEQARLKATALGLTNLEFRQMDAARLEFDGASFDALSCAFTVFFLEDMSAGISEWRRALEPGGVLALSVWGPRAFEPMVSLMVSRQRDYGLAVPSPWPITRTADAEICRQLLQTTGFSDLNIRSEQYGRFLASAADWWDVGSNMGFGSVLTQLSPDQLQQFKTEHLAEIEPLLTDQGLWLNAPVIFALARK